MTKAAMKQVAVFGLLVLTFQDVQPYKRVCYFTNWAQYRTSPMTFKADDVDPFLCTHIMYAFGKVVGNTIDAYEWNDKGTGGQYEKIMNLRSVNPDLKILLAIGGWTHGTAPFTAVVDDPNDMAAFANNALAYLKSYGFDGLDLDWEYPGGNGSPPEDKQRFTSFVQKLRQVFDADGVASNRAPLLLTAAVAAGKTTIDKAYEIDLISKELDFINLMSYDLHGSWEATTGHHSALFGRAGEGGTSAYMNVDYSVNYWINLGAPAEKLVLGMGLYGRSFTLSSSSNTGVGAPAVGAGAAGTYTGEAGLLAYYEVCYNLKYNGWTRQWHSEHKVPYAYHGIQWIGYDDTESFQVKIDYIKSKGLGGGMVWSLDQDDFSNSCGDGAYPLMNLLRSGLSGSPVASTSLPPSLHSSSQTVPSSSTRLPTTIPGTAVSGYKRVCYFTNWAQYRTSPMTFKADDVDPFLCTHIMYAFGKVVGNTIDAYEWNDKGTGGQYEKIMNLRSVNPDLKILLAIGGWTHGTAPFTAVVDDPNDMAAFANNALAYLKSYGFDGLDLDWEYPGGNGSPPEDKQRFTSFVQKLRQVFDADGVASNRAPLLLTAAVAAGKTTIDKAYEIDLISKELDFINLMSYDLHGSWEATTGHHSALFGRAGEGGTSAYMNVDYSVNYWINLGAPAEKLVLGMGLYGRSFTLSSSSNTGVGAPAVGAGAAGTYTGEAGLLAYYEVCYNLKYNGWTRQWHSEHKVPYAYHGIQWIGYDDTESFQVKIDYIKSKGLGGGMVWSLDQDDFSNSCGDGAYPLMNLLRSELFGSAVVSPLLSSMYPSTNVLTSSLSPRGSTTRETGSSSSNYHVSTDSQLSSKRTTQSRTVSGDIFSTTISSICGAPKQCENGRFYEDSCDIRKYYQCSSGVAWHYECAAGTVWDKRIQNCNWDYLVLTSSAPCGCGPPSNCIHGNFYEDKCDMKLYYQCAHGIPYPYECHPGTLWDITITNCNWENAVPSRTTPSGSDCSSYRTTHLPDQQTTVPSTQTQTQMSKTTPPYTEHSTFDSTNRDSSTMKASTSSNTHTQSVDQTTVKPHTTETHTTSQSYTSVTPVSTGQLNTLQSSTFTKQPMVSSTFFIPSSSKSETRINKQSTTSPLFATTGAAVSHSRQQTTSFRVITNDWTQQATTPSIIETTSPTMSKYQHQTTADLTPLQTHQNAATSPSVATTDGTRTNHPQTSMLPNVAVTNGTTTNGTLSHVGTQTTSQQVTTTNGALSQVQQQTTPPQVTTTNGALSQVQQQTTTQTQTTTACGPPDTCPFPSWDSGSTTMTSHLLLIQSGVLLTYFCYIYSC